LRAAEEAGAHSQFIDLKDYQLGLCDDSTEASANALKLRQMVRQAQGIILGTPEYHGSFSGVLKNAIDHLQGKDLTGKIIGLIGVSGGSLGGIEALNGLRTVARSVHAWVIPQQAAIPEAWEAFDTSGKMKDKNLENRVKEVGHQVARFAALHWAERLEEALSA
jgi:FMN reductase